MGDSPSKRKKRFFNSGYTKRSKYALNLCPGIKGFLITHNGHPKFCIREAYNLLDEFFLPKDSQKDLEPVKGEAEEDFESELKKDIENAQNKSKEKEFQVVETGVTGCIFIKTNSAAPVPIVDKILRQIIDNEKCRSRKILRMLPIEVTCKAYLEDIKKAAAPLLDFQFKADAKTYSIIVNRRNNSNILRDELIGLIGLMIRDRSPFHSVDLKKPELTILVEILKNVCCLAVVPEYNKYRKYNLVELGLSCQKSTADKTDSDLSCNKETIEESYNSSEDNESRNSRAEQHIILKNGKLNNVNLDELSVENEDSESVKNEQKVSKTE